jgi:hypothetical protein
MTDNRLGQLLEAAGADVQPTTPDPARAVIARRARARRRATGVAVAGTVIAVVLAVVLPQALIGNSTGAQPTDPGKRAHRQVPPQPSRTKFGATLTLPSQGLAVATRSGVTLYTVAGRRFTSLPGYRITDGYDGQQPVLSDPERRAAGLHGGRVRFVAVKRGRSRSQLTHHGCSTTDHRGPLTVAVCGYPISEQRPTIQVSNGTTRVIAGPATPGKVGNQYDGNWEYALASPDAKWVLGQWSGECEAPAAYMINVATTQRTPLGGLVRGQQPEAFALGWTANNLALVDFLAPVCSSGIPRAGVYLMRPPGTLLHIVVPTPRQSSVVMWGH